MDSLRSGDVWVEPDWAWLGSETIVKAVSRVRVTAATDFNIVDFSFFLW
jgi:hypothetical protein